MKTILIYDFETQSLPLFKEPSEHPGQPHFTQIAAELCEEESGDVLAAINLLVRPEGWEIPQEVQDLTGITMDKAERYGVPEETALNAFLELWCNADIRVAHNESFDARIARIAIMRSASAPIVDRNSVLEEVAAIADRFSTLYTAPDVGYDNGYTMAAKRIAEEIRALKSAAPQQVDAVQAAPEDFPAGAIHNAEAFISRLENIYDFNCEAGPLKNCYEWIELRRCVQHMAEYIAASPSPAVPPVPRGWEDDVRTAWRCVRKFNQTIPDESLDLMRDILLAAGPSRVEAAQGAVPEAARDVLAERRRQVEQEGCTLAHDDTHAVGELADAAGCYATYAFNGTILHKPPVSWPWGADWWKPRDARSNLIRAGALILAEIERLDRHALFLTAAPLAQPTDTTAGE